MASFLVDGEILATPDRLPVLPLRDVVVFPYVVVPLVGRRRHPLAALEAASATRTISSCSLPRRTRDAGAAAGRPLPRRRRGASARQLSRLRTGAVRGCSSKKASRGRESRDTCRATDCARAVIEPMSPLALGGDDDVEAHLRRAVTLFEEYVAVHRRLRPGTVSLIQSSDSPARQTFGIAAHLGTRLERRQGQRESPPDFSVFAAHARRTLTAEICSSWKRRSTTTCVDRCSQRPAQEFYRRNSSRRSTVSSAGRWRRHRRARRPAGSGGAPRAVLARSRRGCGVCGASPRCRQIRRGAHLSRLDRGAAVDRAHRRRARRRTRGRFSTRTTTVQAA